MFRVTLSYLGFSTLFIFFVVRKKKGGRGIHKISSTLREKERERERERERPKAARRLGHRGGDSHLYEKKKKKKPLVVLRKQRRRKKIEENDDAKSHNQSLQR